MGRLLRRLAFLLRQRQFEQDLAEELEFGLASLVRDGRDVEVSGTVRVSLSEGFIRPLVLLLARLHAKYPALAVELISESRVADLARGEADIGIRIVRTASATSGSSRPSSCDPTSRTVTLLPRRRKAWANSTPP